jgi:hypothetical protein
MPGTSASRIVSSILPSTAVIGLSAGSAEIVNESATDGLVAHAGGGQANGLILTSIFNRVITVGTAADSVVLPPATPGWMYLWPMLRRPTA